MVLDGIWNSFLKVVRAEVGSQAVETWLKSVALVNFEEQRGILFFSVPNQFIFSWIRKNYHHLFRKHFPEILARENLEFEFKVESSLSSSSHQQFQLNDSKSQSDRSSESQNKEKQSLSVVGARKLTKKIAAAHPVDISNAKKDSLSSRYNFHNFVVGPNNYLAYSAAQAVSKGYVKRYNPLFIYGKTGLGKTHLLHCIGNEFKILHPEGKVLYKSAMSFVEEFIQAVRNNKLHNFSEKYRKLDLLMIDDIQVLSQKEQTQEMFFNIFNRMYDEKRQIVLSSDTPPSSLQGFQERLISRFNWGLVADVTVPTLETRVAILLKKAEDLKIDLSQDVAIFIATNFASNVREMEGALTRLAAMTMLTFDSISLEFAKKELIGSTGGDEKDKSNLKPGTILEAVLKIFRFQREDICSKRRDNGVVLARQILCYLLKKYTNASLRTIGSYLGGRKHSTILHSLIQVDARIKTDDYFKEKLKEVEICL